MIIFSFTLSNERDRSFYTFETYVFIDCYKYSSYIGLILWVDCVPNLIQTWEYFRCFTVICFISDLFQWVLVTQQIFSYINVW